MKRPADGVADVLGELAALFPRFGIEPGDWPQLALALAIKGGHVKLPGRAPGAPPNTAMGDALTWASVQRVIDSKPNLSVLAACKLPGVPSRAVYNRAIKSPLVKAMISAHKDLGPARFWECLDVDGWKAAVGALTPDVRRGIAAGTKLKAGAHTILGSDPEK